MMGHDEELARLLEPLRAEVADHHRRLVGAGVNPEAVASALAGWGARGMLDYQGAETAAALLRTLAAEIEAGAEMTPGAAKSGGGDSDPLPGATPERIMAGAVRDAAARLAAQGVDAEMISAHALAVAGAMAAQLFGRDGAAERLVAFAKEITEGPKRPTGRA